MLVAYTRKFSQFLYETKCMVWTVGATYAPKRVKHWVVFFLALINSKFLPTTSPALPGAVAKRLTRKRVS